MADDQGWGDTGYNGHPELKTPNLDELATSGLRFNRFYAAHFNCSPTRGSVMTGRHPDRYGHLQSRRADPRAGTDGRAGLAVRRLCDGALWQMASQRQERRQEHDRDPGRAILASDPLSPGQDGFRRMGLRRQFLRPRSGARPQRRAGEIPRRQLGRHDRRGAEVHPPAGRRGQAVPRRRLVWLAACAAPGAAGRQGGLRRAAGERSELLRRNHRRGSQRGPAARGVARTESRRQHPALVLQRQRRPRRTEVHRQPARRERARCGKAACACPASSNGPRASPSPS